jgi:hypothetical protein
VPKSQALLRNASPVPMPTTAQGLSHIELLVGSGITGPGRPGVLGLELSGSGRRPTAIVATCETFGSGRWGGGGLGQAVEGLGLEIEALASLPLPIGSDRLVCNSASGSRHKRIHH